MSSNPYIATHFGGSMDYLRNGSSNGSPGGEHFDASIGFSKIPQSKHMTSSVFKGSKPLPPPKPEYDVHTPTENIIPLRTRFMMNRFPSRPPTPGSLLGSASNGLPPLLPPSVMGTSGVNGGTAGRYGGTPLTEGSTSTGATPSSPQDEERDNNTGRPDSADAPSRTGAAAEPPFTRRDPDSSATPPAASRPSGADAKPHASHQSSSNSAPSAATAGPLAPADNPPLLSHNAGGDASSSHSNHEDGESAVSPISGSPAVEENVSHPVSGAVSPPPTSALDEREDPIQQPSSSPSTRTATAEATSAKPEKNPLGEGNKGAGLTDVDSILQRSRAAISHAQQLLETAVQTSAPNSTSTAVRAGALSGAPDDVATDSPNRRRQFGVPPPLPAVSPLHVPAEGTEEAHVPATTATASSHCPVSPLHDDDFSQFLSPASDVYPQDFPEGQNGRREETVVQMDGAGMTSCPDDDDMDRCVIATRCLVPSQMADRSLARRRLHQDPAEGTVHVAEATPDPTGSFIPQVTQGLEYVADALRPNERSEGRRGQRNRNRSASGHRRRKGDSRRHVGHTTRHGDHQGAQAVGPDVEYDAQRLAQLLRLLQTTGFPTGSSGSAEVPNSATAPVSRSRSRPEVSGSAVGKQMASGVSSELPNTSPTAAAVIRPPAVLAGKTPPQVKVLSRRAASRGRGSNPDALPGYAQPTESWLLKSGEDGDDWFA